MYYLIEIPARMGSFGGGGHFGGGGGHFGGTYHNYTGGSHGGDSDLVTWNTHGFSHLSLGTSLAVTALALVVAFFIPYLFLDKEKEETKRHFFIGNALVLVPFSIWQPSVSDVILFALLFGVCLFASSAQSNDSNYSWTTINITVGQLKNWLKQHDMELSSQHLYNGDVMLHRYAQAELLYSDLVNTKHKHPVKERQLMQYLGNNYYNNEIREIDAKRKAGTYDEIKIRRVELRGWVKTEKYTLVKLYVFGSDKERQRQYSQRVSFESDNWIDYVLFNNYDGKIENIIYGDHFHLNGTDYNDAPDTAERTVERNFKGNLLPTKRDVRKHENKE